VAYGAPHSLHVTASLSVVAIELVLDHDKAAVCLEVPARTIQNSNTKLIIIGQENLLISSQNTERARVIKRRIMLAG
jgi:hypothetical protein